MLTLPVSTRVCCQAVNRYNAFCGQALGESRAGQYPQPQGCMPQGIPVPADLTVCQFEQSHVRRMGRGAPHHARDKATQPRFPRAFVMEGAFEEKVRDWVGAERAWWGACRLSPLISAFMDEAEPSPLTAAPEFLLLDRVKVAVANPCQGYDQLRYTH
jgi:hypothetical protein